MFEKEFVDELPANPGDAGRIVCDTIIDYCERSHDTLHDRYHNCIKGYEILRIIAEVSSIPISEIKLTGFEFDIGEAIKLIYNNCLVTRELFLAVSLAYLSDGFREIITLKYGLRFYYEFTQGDLERIQVLINELREHIATANGLSEEHRQRLLARLERLQSELHKKISDLDRFWGLIGDAGVVLGKLGENAKPIVDRIKEVSNIVWRTQAKKEELPSDIKPALLESKIDEI